MINTVEGRISAETIGVTMCHEHLAMDLSPVRKDRDSVFDDLELIEEEVKLMKALGVQSVIEVSCNDMGSRSSRRQGSIWKHTIRRMSARERWRRSAISSVKIYLKE